MLFRSVSSNETTFEVLYDLEKTNITEAFFKLWSDNYKSTIKFGYDSDRFIFPFYIRYAIKLYDGSYINISAPILVIPDSNKKSYGLDWLTDSGGTTQLLFYSTRFYLHMHVYRFQIH